MGLPDKEKAVCCQGEDGGGGRSEKESKDDVLV